MINLNIKTLNMTLTPAISEYLEKGMRKVERMLDDHRTDSVAHVELGKTTAHHHAGEVFKAQMTIAHHGMNLVASSEEETLYAAIDAMQEEMVREITSHKDKRITLLRRGGRSIKKLARRLWPF